jgi:uncharacterized membrane protein YphA (DoxX/SURF4 family)
MQASATRAQWRKYIPASIGALFLYTGVLKLLFPNEAVGALQSLDFKPWLANGTVAVATVLELYLGILLVFKVDLKYAMAMATGLMFVFTCYLFYLANMAHPPSCGCLGLTGLFNSNKQNAIFGVFRNCVILWGLKLGYDYQGKKVES